MSDENPYPPAPRRVDTYAPPPPQPADDVPPYLAEPLQPFPADPSATYPVEPLSAPLKPLLNPLQSGDSPMPSTIVEPPRSPNPANGATDDNGNNVELDIPSSSASVVGPADIPPTSVERPVESSDSVLPSSAFLPEPTQLPMSSAGPSPSPTPVPRPPSPSSLPRDAPMPPTPNPIDEPVPVLEPGLIPPAVPTPDVITTEDVEEEPLRSAAPPPETVQPSPLEAQPAVSEPLVPAHSAMEIELTAAASGAPPTPPEDEQPLASQAPIPEAVPAPEPVIAPAASFAPPPEAAAPLTDPATLSVPVESTEMPPPAPAPTDDAMDIDAKGEEAAPASDSASSASGVKRPGEDLEGRDEKRVKEEGPVAPVATPVVPEEAQAPLVPLPPRDPNAPPPPWETYTPPPPKYSGPITPLTSNQHRHLLNAVRNLKKNGASTNFLAPVNVELFGIPHYIRIIEKPMDLGTVETKLVVSDPRGPPKDKSKMSKWDESKGKYSNVSEVVQDVRQIWENTRNFNGPTHVVSEAATKLETTFEKSLNNLPPEPAAVQPAPPVPAPAPAAGPSSHTRRPSVSQLPTIRRSSDGPDHRPKREIHAPPSKELPYADAKPRRRTDSQLRWALKTIRGLESSSKTFGHVSPFLYPVEQIVAAIPDYTSFIDRPIDLNIIKRKIEDGEYDDVHQVNSDMHLMVRNAIKFNPPSDSVAVSAHALKEIWEDKWAGLPPKNEVRDESEDPSADFEDSVSDQEDTSRLHKLENQLAKLQAEIASIKDRQAARKAARPKKKSKAGGRKSFSKTSPGVNGHGATKKQKKHREMAFKDDDEVDSEEEARNVTMSQKQELAEKINQVDEATLTKAVDIIKETMQLSSEQEIELDIELLPPRTIYRLYNLVCRGGRRAPRSKPGQGRKSSGKKAGGARKTVNEQQEEERIRRMEQQLQNFDSGRGGMGWEGGEESESSDEESSDED